MIKKHNQNCRSRFRNGARFGGGGGDEGGGGNPRSLGISIAPSRMDLHKVRINSFIIPHNIKGLIYRGAMNYGIFHY